MALYTPIQTKDPMDSMSQLADFIEKQNQMKNALKFQYDQLGQQGKYQQGQLNIQNRQENRQDKFTPYKIQQYGDIHSTSMMNNMINQKAMQRAEAAWPYIKQQYEDAHKGNASDLGLKQVKNEVLRMAYQHELENATGGQQQQNAPPEMAIPQTEPGDFSTQGQNQNQQGFPTVSPAAQQANVIPAMPNVSQAAQQANVIPGGQNTMPGQQQLPSPPQINMPGQNAPAMQGNEIGKETVISQGDPNRSFLNIEGKPSNAIKNGYLIKTFPNGKVTATKLPADMGKSTTKGPLTLEEKMSFEKFKQELKKDTATQKGVENQTAKLNDRVRGLKNTRSTLEKIIPVLEKRGDITGKVASGLAGMGLSTNEDIAGLETNFGALQGDLANLFNSKAGYKTIEWAKTIKPGIGKQENYNIGQINSTIDHINDMLKQEEDNYRILHNGKEMPNKEKPLERIQSKTNKVDATGKKYSDDPKIQSYAEDAIKRGAKESDILQAIKQMQGGT